MPTTRRVRVLLFAGLRQRAGADAVEIDVPVQATAAELCGALERAHPEFGSLAHCRVAADQAFIGPADSIAQAQELALIPPVSGGHDGSSATDGSHARLSFARLDLTRVVDRVAHARAGGINTFTGQVREQSRGKQVSHLEYEAYAPMAVRVMDQIAQRIESEIPGSRVCIHHRLGRLQVGELAVVIAASAPHRAEAFAACRAAIEALKQDVPIWKKEFDPTGGVWISQGP